MLARLKRASRRRVALIWAMVFAFALAPVVSMAYATPGDKAFVTDEIQRYNALLGVNNFLMRVQWPGLEQAKVLRTIATLGEIFA